MWERIKKIFGLKNPPKASQSGGQVKDIKGIPKEILDKLPPGVKIKKIEIGPSQILRTVIIMIIIYMATSALLGFLIGDCVAKVSLSEVLSAIKQNKVEEVTVMDNEIMAKLKDGGKILTASKESNAEMSDILQKEGIDISTVKFTVENRSGWKALGDMATLLLSVGVPILFILWFFSRQTGGLGGGGMFGFGKSTAKLFIKGKQNMNFKDEYLKFMQTNKNLKVNSLY